MQSETSPTKVLLLSILGNLAVFIAKMLGGILSGSLALLADGADSSLNVFSSSIAYYFYKKSQKPPDQRHPYGHEKFEVFGSLLILLLMVLTFSAIGFLAIHRLLEGMPEKIDPVSIVFALFSLVLNLTVSTLLKRFSSESLLASTESRHISLDVAEGATTLAGVTLGSYLSSLYDLFAAIVILVIVTYFVLETLKDLREQIVDTSPDIELSQIIEEAIKNSQQEIQYHALRSRKSGRKIYADLHLVVPKELSVEEAHKICDEIEKKAKEKLGENIDITIHVEPAE
ncbi:cation diffusion facilitator family transporter [Thermofilum sp.]|jgi:cation diffusion facilitator family transporter|uniref:cation diffusion facilitator family transporter n=1 Tax=Thermofilum sp. TaxID=1961369 RepID=UPI00258B59A2|nr:cation diffusion facilitator family transporter [Thermofilum sp.]